MHSIHDQPHEASILGKGAGNKLFILLIMITIKVTTY